MPRARDLESRQAGLCWWPHETEGLELRFAPPSTPIDPDAPPLVVSTVVL